MKLSRALIDWYLSAHRDLPWRRTSDPYRIWVSEIMLQQTRAQAVIPYYERFLNRYPGVDALASSTEEDVLTLWSGLGYYSRARNLRAAALRIVEAGSFPRDYESIRELPGIGEYTAAAISSIAFGLPYAVLDGNVLRVVARVENDAADIAAPRTRARFNAVAQAWLDRKRPGLFNQAIMELGATVCLPRNPLCGLCPLAEHCRARGDGTAAQLPVKLRKREPERIEGVLLIVERRGRVMLRQRHAADRRMAGFWDLPAPDDLPDACLAHSFGEIRHTITHHHYTFAVRAATLGSNRPGAEFRWFAPKGCGEIPLSTAARKALRLAGFLPSVQSL